MAGKKPAKPIAGQGKDKQSQLPGKAIKYFSPVKGKQLFKCPTCSRTLSKGIVYEHEGTIYCKRGCIKVKTESQYSN